MIEFLWTFISKLHDINKPFFLLGKLQNSQNETRYYRNSQLFSKTSKIANNSFSKTSQIANNSFYSHCCPIMIFLSHCGITFLISIPQLTAIHPSIHPSIHLSWTPPWLSGSTSTTSNYSNKPVVLGQSERPSSTKQSEPTRRVMKVQTEFWWTSRYREEYFRFIRRSQDSSISRSQNTLLTLLSPGSLDRFPSSVIPTHCNFHRFRRKLNMSISPSVGATVSTVFWTTRAYIQRHTRDTCSLLRHYFALRQKCGKYLPRNYCRLSLAQTIITLHWSPQSCRRGRRVVPSRELGHLQWRLGVFRILISTGLHHCRPFGRPAALRWFRDLVREYLLPHDLEVWHFL